MPIYEYTCCKCGDEFEELVLNSSEKINCPRCKSDKIKKKMSAPSSGSSCNSCSSGTCSTCGG